MVNLQNKKLDLKEFLEELGFTVSLDYEREPTGTLFAEIHPTITQVNNNLSVYQAFRTLEIELMAICTEETENSIYSAVRLLSDEHYVYANTVTDNTNIVKMRGNYYD
nr:MAG TPA: hypothetical protein [Caudoviricetes sp.]